MRKYLEISNPHWFGEKDPYLKKWEEQKIKWIPKWINEISLKPFSLNFVVGARQTGKTTGLKFLIKKLIENGTEAEKIIYLNVDIIPDLNQFREIIYWISKNNFQFIFLDEVTSLKDWWKIIKFFIDSGKLENNVLTISGSSSLKIKRHAELFPGRRGKGKIVEVLPLSFKDYYFLFHEKIKSEDVEKRFEEYLENGGFPDSINRKADFFGNFISFFETEVLKNDLSIELGSKIISTTLSKIPSALSYHSIASDIGIDHKTVRTYLETFENMYLIKIAYWKYNNQIYFRKEKKIFFRDPVIYKIFSFWTKRNFLQSALYEGVVQEHLLRKYGEVYYYRNSYEIDCIANNLKIEVKAGKSHRKYPKNVIILDEDNIAEFLLKL